MTFELRSNLRPRAAHPLTLLAVVLLACGDSDAAGAGKGLHSGKDGAVGQTDAGNGGTGGGTPSDPDSCSMDSDCGFGEIDHEIRSKSDCPCLLGCPYIPQNKETLERRRAQYTALCEPRTDGQGMPCPIDDCVQMPDAVCVNGTCGGARQR